MYTQYVCTYCMQICIHTYMYIHIYVYTLFPYQVVGSHQ